MNPETSHELVHKLGRAPGPIWKLLLPGLATPCKGLQVDLAGVQLDNPVGLAAGFDKNGKLIHMLGHLGFGFAEIGSVTARSWGGNPKPRLFRLEQDEALINRMGLNSEGVDAVSQRLAQISFSLPVGLNIAKTNDPSISGDAAIEDILYTFKKVKDTQISYISVNASCPNTKDKIAEHKQDLSILLKLIQTENTKKLPVFVKLSPDGPDEFTAWMVESGIEHGLSGYICGNSTINRNDLITPSVEIERIGAGGLTGRPLKQAALKLCSLVYSLKAANQVIVGCGGISSGADAYEFIRSGASAVQLYTGLIFHGPTLIRDINDELLSLLKADGLSLAQAIGAGLR
jgi:dihydroorotate dehydrogenase